MVLRLAVMDTFVSVNINSTPVKWYASTYVLHIAIHIMHCTMI